jgi:hypothetical protein
LALDLTPASDKAAAYHERFVEETLPDELKLAAFEAFDPSAYDDEQLSRGRRAWQLRALDEYRSLAAFADLLALLARMGAASDLIGTCARLVRDEDRHVELCRRMVRALGGDDVMPGEPMFTTPTTGSELARVLHHVAGSLGVGETYSMMVLAEMRDRTEDALARAVVEQIARDESLHSRFGWVALRALYPDLDEDARALLRQTVARALASAQRMVEEGAGRSHPFGSIDVDMRARAAARAEARVRDELAALASLP